MRPRRSVMEKSWSGLGAGLMREALGSSELGAKTRPPCARAEASATIHPIPRAAAVATNRPYGERKGGSASLRRSPETAAARQASETTAAARGTADTKENSTKVAGVP